MKDSLGKDLTQLKAANDNHVPAGTRFRWFLGTLFFASLALLSLLLGKK